MLLQSVISVNPLCVIEAKGIVFKQDRHRKVMLIHKDSLIAYLNALPSNEKGWHLFSWDTLAKRNARGVFAKIIPINPKENK